jgi:hypothetical protein
LTLFLKDGHNFGRGSPKDHFSKVWLKLAQQFQRRSFFFISSPLFSIFSLAAILVGSRDHRTQFWKGANQGSFQCWWSSHWMVLFQKYVRPFDQDGPNSGT